VRSDNHFQIFFWRGVDNSVLWLSFAQQKQMVATFESVFQKVQYFFSCLLARECESPDGEALSPAGRRPLTFARPSFPDWPIRIARTAINHQDCRHGNLRTRRRMSSRKWTISLAKQGKFKVGVVTA
jgi:hypothetical protein